MSTRPTDWSAFGLDGDPIPGDPVAAAASAACFQRNADAIAKARDNLQRLDTSSNESVALDKVKEQIRKVAADLAKVQSRVEGAAKALTDYSPLLEGAQAESSAALEVAVQAVATRRIHQEQRDSLRDQVRTTADPLVAQELAEDVRREQAAVDSAGSSLAAAKTRLAQAIKSRDDAATDAMGHLDKVSAGSQVKEGVLDKIVHTVAKVVTKVVEWGKVIVDNLDLIAMVLTVVGLVLSFIPFTAPLGILMMGVGQALGKLAAIISVVKTITALAGAAVGVLSGTLSPQDFLVMVAVVAIAVGVGIVVGKLGGRFAKSITKRGALYRKMPKSLRTNLKVGGKQVLNPIVGPAKVGNQTALQKLFSIPSWNDKAKVSAHLNLSATLRGLVSGTGEVVAASEIKSGIPLGGVSADGLEAAFSAGGAL